jgi:hypothetical protein
VGCPAQSILVTDGQVLLADQQKSFVEPRSMMLSLD